MREGDEVQRGVGPQSTLSGVGLGISFRSHAPVALQYARLNRRLKRLEDDAREIKQMKQAEFCGALYAGLTRLKMAGGVGTGYAGG